MIYEVSFPFLTVLAPEIFRGKLTSSTRPPSLPSFPPQVLIKRGSVEQAYLYFARSVNTESSYPTLHH